MPAHPDELLRYIRRLVAGPALDPASDAALLGRFVRARDEDAFAALVKRYGRLVLGACRRVLGDAHEAEDAAQATFLVLARKAVTIRRPEALAAWLHKTAHGLAQTCRRAEVRRRQRETRALLAAPERRQPDTLEQVSARELLHILDEELQHLPEVYRLPLLLCCLEGRTQEEAAAQLGWTADSVRGRLERGRSRLHARLCRRGLELSAALAAVELSQGAAGAGAAGLSAAATARAAVAFVAHRQAPTGAGVSARVLALAEGGVKGMVLAKAQIGMALLLAGGMLAAGTGVVAHQMLGAKQTDGKPEAEPPPGAKGVERAQPESREQAHTDLYGDRLPDGAGLRLGTIKRRAVQTKLALAGDGRSIVGVRAGKYVSIWDTATAKLRQTRELPGEPFDPWRPENFWLSPNGDWLARSEHSGGVGTLSLLDPWTGKQAHQFAVKNSYGISLAAFSPDGRMVAAIGDYAEKKGVRVWDLLTGKEVFANDRPNDQSMSLRITFTPDSKRLLVSFSDGKGTRCWEIATGQLVWEQKELKAGSLAFTRDGKILVSTDPNRAVDLATGQFVPLEKKPPLAKDTELTLAPDGRTLLLATATDVVVWDLISGKKLRTLAGTGEQLLITPDSKRVVTSNGALESWDLATGKRLYADNFEHGHVGEVRAIAFSAHGERLASVSTDGSVRLWDTRNGQPLRAWRAHQPKRHLLSWEDEGPGATAVAISPDARWVLSGAGDEPLRLWDGSTGTEAVSFILPPRDDCEVDRIVSCAWISPDRRRAHAFVQTRVYSLVGGQETPNDTSKLATWDGESGKLLNWYRIVNPKQGEISADGRRFLTNGILFDVATGKEIVRLEDYEPDEPSLQSNPLIFSQDGSLVLGHLLKGPNFVGIRLWEALTGKTVGDLGRSTGTAGYLAFHPDHRFIAISARRGFQVWDVLSGTAIVARDMPERLPSSRELRTYVSCLAFTPDGRQLATGLPDGTILLWNIPLPKRSVQVLSGKERDSLWDDLSSADAGKAWRAVWQMVDGPQDALPFLRDRLRPAPPVLALDAKEVQRLLADLDSDQFSVRESAMKQLVAMGEQVKPAVLHALEGKPSPEVRKRLEDLLDKAFFADRGIVRSPEVLRTLRALRMLEQIGTPEAQKVLQTLATGDPAARPTREAKEALARLAGRAGR